MTLTQFCHLMTILFHPCPDFSQPISRDWYVAIVAYVGFDDVEAAVNVAWCESKGDVYAMGDSGYAYGLYQLHAYEVTWSGWAPWGLANGWTGDVMDPISNAWLTRLIVESGRGWEPWTCATNKGE